jgi:hypothetical protein
MQDAKKPPQEQPWEEIRKLAGLQREVDERDETIRLLNEALSDALEQLDRLSDSQAA